jgi:hypothetical protein
LVRGAPDATPRGNETVVHRTSFPGPRVQITLTPECPSSDGDPSPSVIEVDGGCVTYQASVPERAEPVPSFDADGGLSSISRDRLVTYVENEFGCRLGAS